MLHGETEGRDRMQLGFEAHKGEFLLGKGITTPYLIAERHNRAEVNRFCGKLLCFVRSSRFYTLLFGC